MRRASASCSASAAALLAGMLITVLLGSGQQAVAATTAAPASTNGVATAEAAYRAVSDFRVQSRQDLSGFLTKYGGRLTAEQNARAKALAAQADMTLAQLEAKTRATRSLARAGASSARIRRAAVDANVAYEAAAAATAAALAECQPLLQDKLSLFEGFQAKLDLDTSLRDFADVGAAVKAVRP